MKLKLISIALLLLAASCGGGNKAPDSSASTAEEHPGKQTFQANCAQCHTAMKNDGMILKGVVERWGNDKAKLGAFIKNSQAMIQTDAYAAELYKKWSNMIMPAFPKLSDADINNVIDYIDSGAN